MKLQMTTGRCCFLLSGHLNVMLSPRVRTVVSRTSDGLRAVLRWIASSTSSLSSQAEPSHSEAGGNNVRGRTFTRLRAWAAAVVFSLVTFTSHQVTSVKPANYSPSFFHVSSIMQSISAFGTSCRFCFSPFAFFADVPEQRLWFGFLFCSFPFGTRLRPFGLVSCRDHKRRECDTHPGRIYISGLTQVLPAKSKKVKTKWFSFGLTQHSN